MKATGKSEKKEGRLKEREREGARKKCPLHWVALTLRALRAKFGTGSFVRGHTCTQREREREREREIARARARVYVYPRTSATAMW
jgi:hypothetical protein